MCHLKHFTWQDENELFSLGCVGQQAEAGHEASQTWIVFPFLPLAGYFFLCFLLSLFLNAEIHVSTGIPQCVLCTESIILAYKLLSIDESEQKQCQKILKYLYHFPQNICG